MSKDISVNTLSIQDVVEAYKNYDASEKVKDELVFFLSELTGLSVDTILSY